MRNEGDEDSKRNGTSTRKQHLDSGCCGDGNEQHLRKKGLAKHMPHRKKEINTYTAPKAREEKAASISPFKDDICKKDGMRKAVFDKPCARVRLLLITGLWNVMRSYSLKCIRAWILARHKNISIGWHNIG